MRTTDLKYFSISFPYLHRAIIDLKRIDAFLLKNNTKHPKMRVSIFPNNW